MFHIGFDLEGYVKMEPNFESIDLENFGRSLDKNPRNCYVVLPNQNHKKGQRILEQYELVLECKMNFEAHQRIEWIGYVLGYKEQDQSKWSSLGEKKGLDCRMGQDGSEIDNMPN